MITCTRRVQFCAGHRVYRHESKCANVHGHNYVALFEARAAALDAVGRVIDFSVLKERIGGWIDRMWDHGFLVCDRDVDLLGLLAEMNTKRFVMDCNPTAENMAEFLLRSVCPAVLDGTGVEVVRVTLWETENCFATAEVDR